MSTPGKVSILADDVGKADGITEIRRQEALLKTGALQNAILTSANFSIIATDEKGIIQLFNVGAERMLGYQAAEVVNKINPSDIHDPQEVRARAQALSLELATPIAPGFEALALKASRGIDDVYELTYICKDGSRFPAHGLDHGAARRLRRHHRLPADRQRQFRAQAVESELNEAMAAAEKANRAKTDFLSSMSHELRTPLNAILGFAQLMESGAPTPTPPQKRNLDQILKAGWYLLDLINEILDLALIESGTVILSREPVSLVEVMLECRAMIEPQAQKRGIRHDVSAIRRPLLRQRRPHPRQAGPDQPSLQRHQVQQAEWRGRRRVHAASAGFDPHQRPGHRRGPGAGAAGAAVPAVQSPRQGGQRRGRHGHRPGGHQAAGRTDGRRHRRGQRRRRRQHVLDRIEPDRGAAVCRPAESESAAPARPQVPDGAPLRTLLYVEDNPANLELVEQLIARRPDLRLLSAADGNLGIEFARAYQPDVILMDINLPGISGIEALKILRADPATAHIPIIALSANAMPRDIEKGLEAGFFSYLTKPIKVNQFMDALDAALKSAQGRFGRAADKADRHDGCRIRHPRRRAS